MRQSTQVITILERYKKDLRRLIDDGYQLENAMQRERCQDEIVGKASDSLRQEAARRSDDE